jgi:hypothetical protein
LTANGWIRIDFIGRKWYTDFNLTSAIIYTRLGVDFESLNPTAYGFWLKYFDAYTHSVVRRIDEKAVMLI